MIEQVHELSVGDLTVRCVRPHLCGRASCTALTVVASSEVAPDRWFACGDLLAPASWGGDPPPEVIDVALEEFLEHDEVIAKGCAAFGIPWEDLSPEATAAQLRLTAGAPAWFVTELQLFSAEQLYDLRDALIGSQESMVEALRAIHDYRHNVNRRVPLGFVDGEIESL